MTSPYFMENRSVMTRSASQTAGRTPAASLRTKLTNRRRNEDPVCAVPVKVEEKSVSELRASSTPLSAGNANHTN